MKIFNGKIVYCCVDCGIIIWPSTALRGSGRCKSCENRHRGEIGTFKGTKIGKKNPNWRGGKPNCKICGKKLSRKDADLCKNCYVDTFHGISSPGYVHGFGYFPHPLEFSHKLRRKIRERDNHKCQICGKSEIENKKKLDVHHIDYNKHNCKENNLISLCHICHLKTGGNRDYWYAYCTYLMENR